MMTNDDSDKRHGMTSEEVKTINPKYLICQSSCGCSEPERSQLQSPFLSILVLHQQLERSGENDYDVPSKAIGLPPQFLALEQGSKGGGVIEGSASECVLVSMLAARASGIKRLKHQFPNVDEGLLLSKLIAYCSKEAHSCVEKAAMICFVKLRILQPDEHASLRGETLKQAMEEDEEAGRVPFFVSVTLGTTSCCSFDNLAEIGPTVRKFPGVWLHVDAAYAGSAFLCPEHQHHLAGVEYADSFNTNPNKLMLTNFDSSLLWVTNRRALGQFLGKQLVVCAAAVHHHPCAPCATHPIAHSMHAYYKYVFIQLLHHQAVRTHTQTQLSPPPHYADAFRTQPEFIISATELFTTLSDVRQYLLTSALVVDPLYLQHCYDHTAIDYRHWGIPLSRRFRSLKLWFMLRSYGVCGLQKYVRRHCELAKYFEQLVRKDDRFEVCNQVTLGLVCFRLLGGGEETGPQQDEINKKLLTNINASGKIHMVPANVRDRFVIRFCVVAQHATREDIETAWDIITDFATELLEGPDKERVSFLSNNQFDFRHVRSLEEAVNALCGIPMMDLNEERARRHRAALAHKRSFFVRMVSDPKIYNPAINKTPPPVAASPCSPPPAPPAPETPDTPCDADGMQLQPPTPKQASWISWPLAFFFQSVDHDANDLPLRFRHLDTMVRLKSPGGGRRGSSPGASPERRAPSPSH
ncbi:hypothetical protein MSG28_003496 [Choristoneura fumiferana]|uniref:Uncharacterized protein n=1 Tax=Choristoneura fumiferana TaxID=7141 RepID=A0ACC0KFU9_CHOFU|nr:hypothetical protein MSG28_003496 [Choristoneura fumiferana]